jgi:hypothetical protein
LYAQHPAWRNYTINEGLPSNEVYASIQDSRGYIWFGAWPNNQLALKFFRQPHTQTSTPLALNFQGRESWHSKIFLIEPKLSFFTYFWLD